MEGLHAGSELPAREGTTQKTAVMMLPSGVFGQTPLQLSLRGQKPLEAGMVDEILGDRMRHAVVAVGYNRRRQRRGCTGQGPPSSRTGGDTKDSGSRTARCNMANRVAPTAH